MLCVAGPQAAVLFMLLALAGHRPVAGCSSDADVVLEARPDGHYRLFRHGAQSGNGDNDSDSAREARILCRYWQGPFWFTLVLRDPYFPLSRPDLVTVWSSGQSAHVWRRFCVLLRSAQWANDQGGAARLGAI